MTTYTNLDGTTYFSGQGHPAERLWVMDLGETRTLD